MFGNHQYRFPRTWAACVLISLAQSAIVAQVQISGVASYYRSFNAHLNAGNERLDILGMGTSPTTGLSYFVCKTSSILDCPSSDQLHVYVHNTASNQWEYEGSIDHSGAIDRGCVDVSGDTVVIGRTFANFGEDGVDIYRRGFDAEWIHEAQLLPNDNFPGNQFGFSVSIDGDILAVGAPKDDPDDDIHAWEGKGSVYIYDRINGVWGLTEKVTTGSGLQGDDFGASVAIRSSSTGWNLVVGAPDHSTDSGGINEAGAIYAFQNDGTQWQQTDVASLTRDSFISGQFGANGIGFDGAVVAALDDSDLHVYEMNISGQLIPIGMWPGSSYLSVPIVVNRQVVLGDPYGSLDVSGGVPNVTMISVDQFSSTTTAVLPAPSIFQPADRYAYSVAFNGGVFLAGAPDHDASGENAGAIWSQSLVANTYPTGLILEGQADQHAAYGKALAANDEWAVVGIPNSRNPCISDTTGSIRIYRSLDGQWVDYGLIEPPVPGISQGFGHAVAIDGNRIAVGMPDSHRVGSQDSFGAVVLYEFDGFQWQQIQLIEGPSLDHGFGDAIALAGSHLAVGTPDGGNAGFVAMYELDLSGQFQFVTSLLPGSLPGSSRYGSSISMHDDTLLVGAPLSSSQTGHVDVWTFDHQSMMWQLGPALTAPPLVAGSGFGMSMAQTDDFALIGVPGNQAGAGQVALYPVSGQGFGAPQLISAPSSVAATGFGATIAAKGNLVVIGHSDPATTQAQFMVYNGVDLQHIQTLSVPTGDAAAEFGSAVAVGAGTLFVGAPSDSYTPGHRSGMVHLFGTELRFIVPECDMDMQSDRIQWIQDDIPENGEWFASSIEVDDGYAIAGTPYEKYSFVYNGSNINANNAGKVTIYERTGLRTWSPVATFRGGNIANPSAGFQNSDWLGESVDIERNTAVAGGRQATDENNGSVVSGSVRVYEKGTAGWYQSFEIFPIENQIAGSTPVRNFGSAVDLDSTASLLAVGARSTSLGATGTGAGFVFERTGASWTRSDLLVPPNLVFATHIGDSASIEEDWAVFGAQDDSSSGSVGAGAVHLFRRTGLGVWVFHTTLISPNSRSSGRFGSQVEISRSDLGLTLIVAAHSESHGGWPGTGAAYVFVLDETTLQWNLVQELLPSIFSSSIAYGKDLSIDHNTLAIGAPYLHDVPSSPSQWTGGVELYNLDQSGTQFTYRTTIRPEPNQWGSINAWGTAIGLSGGTVFLGTPTADGEPYDPANQNMNYGAMTAHDIVCVDECPADLDANGVLDFFDISAFLVAYSAQSPGADFNGDGVVNFFDVSEFVSAYLAGC